MTLLIPSVTKTCRFRQDIRTYLSDVVVNYRRSSITSRTYAGGISGATRTHPSARCSISSGNVASTNYTEIGRKRRSTWTPLSKSLRSSCLLCSPSPRSCRLPPPSIPNDTTHHDSIPNLRIVFFFS
jgi:hypothetical protein